MPRPRNRVPSLVHHKPSGQGRVRIAGQDFYCGPWGQPETEERYRQILAEFLSTGEPPSADDAPVAELSINELALRYLQFAEVYYRKDGRPTGQMPPVRSTLRVLREFCGHERAGDFGPRRLKLLQQDLIRRGWSRKYINDTTDRVKRVFKWAVSEELLPVSVYDALRTVPGLKKGRSAAKETEPVGPVPGSVVDATLPHLPRVVADMVRLQLATGARPSEVCLIRPCEISIGTDGVWCYRPASHKTEHRGRERRIFIGPKGQEILRPYLDRDPEAYCFDPADSEAERNAERRANRRSPMTPSQAARQPKANRRRPSKGHYTKDSYCRAIARACEKAFGMPAELRYAGRTVAKLPDAKRSAARERLSRAAAEWRAEHCWSPNQLRHSRATLLRERYGLEAAQVVLGHSDPRVTEIYAERDFAAARRIMAEVG